MSTGHRADAQWLRGVDAQLVVAIYIARTYRTQFHAGLYHRDHGASSVLHFAWDRDLRNDAPGDVLEGRDYGLIALSIDEDDAQALCALCRQVARKHTATFRFRFAEWRSRFDPDTAEVIPAAIDERYGFTCATSCWRCCGRQSSRNCSRWTSGLFQLRMTQMTAGRRSSRRCSAPLTRRQTTPPACSLASGQGAFSHRMSQEERCYPANIGPSVLSIPAEKVSRLLRAFRRASSGPRRHVLGPSLAGRLVRRRPARYTRSRGHSCKRGFVYLGGGGGRS